MAATTRAFYLEGNDELLVHHRGLHRDSCNIGCQLRDGRAFTRRGCCQVCNAVHCVLVEIPVIQIFSGVVRRSVGGARLILNQEAPLPVGGGKKHFKMGENFVSQRPLVPIPTIMREHSCFKQDMVGVFDHLLA